MKESKPKGKGWLPSGNKELVTTRVQSIDGDVPGPKAVDIGNGIFNGVELVKDRAVETPGNILAGVINQGKRPLSVRLVDLVEVWGHVEHINDKRGKTNNPGVNCSSQPCGPADTKQHKTTKHNTKHNTN